MNDLRQAVRSLRKSPRFTIAAVVTLGVAIAADCVVFSVADAVLFRPLPYKEPDRLVHVFTAAHSPLTAPGLQDVVEWRRRNNVFEDIALTSPQDVSLRLADYPEPLTVMAATANVFDVLGVKAARGRTFFAADGFAGAADQVAILGYDFWQTRFHGDPGVIGKQIDLSSGMTRTIIGVLPRGLKFSYPDGAPVWIPMAWDRRGPRPAFTGLSDTSNLITTGSLAIARLKPGITASQAQAAMRPVLKELEPPNPRYPTEARLIGLQGWSTRQVRSLLITLLGAVTFLLLIGCANVANLILARMADRHRETAIRASLGAGRWRMVREFLAESLVLALAAGAFGLLLSAWGMEAVRSVLPPELPRGDELGLDWRVALFALGLSVMSAVVFGLLPALKWSRTDPSAGLAGPTGSVGGRYHNRIRAVLVGAETALALVLTGGAGLMMNSFIRLTHVDLGFDPNNVLAIQCTQPKQYEVAALNEWRPNGGDARERLKRAMELQRSIDRTNGAMLEALRAIPGVQHVALAFEPPMFKGGLGGLFLPPKPGSQVVQGRSVYVSGDYFKAMQIPFLAGRSMRTDTQQNQEREIVLSQSFAKLLIPDGGALGQILPGAWRIVGIVPEVRHRLLSPSEPTAYMHSLYIGGGHFMVRYSEGAKADMSAAIRRTLNQIEPGAAVAIDSMDQVVARQGAQTRFLALLFSAAGLLGLLLSASGVFAVTAYSVNQRTREIGVRVALGATPGNVLKMMMFQAVTVAAAGAVAGTAGLLALQNVIRSMLFDVSPTDPLTLFAVVAVLAFATAAAVYIPARRSLKVDPATALRYE